MISYGTAGPLGVLYLPRFWLKISPEEQGKLGARLSWHRQNLGCSNRQIANAFPESRRVQSSEFAKQALMRIVEQPGGSRSIYEYETIFELAPDFCANCIRASLLAGPGQPDCTFPLLGHRYHSRGGLDRAGHRRTGDAGR